MRQTESGWRTEVEIEIRRKSGEDGRERRRQRDRHTDIE